MSLRCLAFASLVATVVAVPISLDGRRRNRQRRPRPGLYAAAHAVGRSRPQGNYTNLYENGTPLERPDEFAGRTLDEVRGRS